MVAVPNTNVYLVVLDGGDCPDSAIKCTSVSNRLFPGLFHGVKRITSRVVQRLNHNAETAKLPKVKLDCARHIFFFV